MEYYDENNKHKNGPIINLKNFEDLHAEEGLNIFSISSTTYSRAPSICPTSLA
jgi:hypothetical protein